MFQFRAFPSYTYLIQCMLTVSSTAGFPHSEIHGSQAAFASPWLIVDRYVLRRLLVPRHSPYALSSLTMFFSRDSSVLRLRSRRRSNDSSRKVLILCSNHLVLVWVFPSTITYCSCYPKIFYHFTFTCALFSFQGTCEPFGSLGNFVLVFVFSFAALCFCMRKNEKRKTTEIWWAQVDSNHRPHAYQACALTC